MLVRNKDARPQAYDEMKEKFRPSHADFTYQTKYGHRNHEGGDAHLHGDHCKSGAGAVAKKILSYDRCNSELMWNVFMILVPIIEIPIA